MQRNHSPSDTSTDIQDTSSGSSSFSAEESIEDSEDLNDSRRAQRGQTKRLSEDTEKRPYTVSRMEELLKDLEQEEKIDINTPLTTEEEEKDDPLPPQHEGLTGGRIMLPLSDFFNPRIHFPITPQNMDGVIKAETQKKIDNAQYINKGLAPTLKYQMYMKSLMLMNRMAAADRKAPKKEVVPEKSVSAQEEAQEKVTPPRQKRRMAALKQVKLSKEETEEETEEEEAEEDNVEKILAHSTKEDLFYVKYRDRSYLHCEWLPRAALVETKIGEMRVRRFLKSTTANIVSEPIDETTKELFSPELLEVERVITEEEEITENMHRRIYLIKWRKFPYEASTFEYYDHINSCSGFEQAHRNFLERRAKAREPSRPLNWRPSRDKIEENERFKGDKELRPYQKEGVHWLVNRWLFRQSCILADEMGLGKTVQSVAFIETVITRCGHRRPALVVAPLSTIPHWEREFAAWCNLRVLVYHGPQSAREIMYEFEFRKGSALLFDVILTTYEMAIAGADHLSSISFGVSVLDEAHRLKNSRSKAAQALRSIEIDHKVLLSGTPLQNNLGELWSLLNFIDPDKFPCEKAFLSAYRMEAEDDVERIQGVLRPIMLRRMKDDVETIPVKEETIVEVELTMIQKRFYRAILERNIEFLSAAGSSTPNLLNVMMELRKCCIHPYLIAGAEEQILLENGQGKDVDAVERNDYYRILIQSSGKLVFLDKLLNKLKGEHKVLVFSQMTKCLDLIADYLQYKGYPYERIDGTVRGEIRQAAIDRFTEDEKAFVFLLCTRAGGVGINLTAADTVIIFDSDWNPQNDLQAQARCHRIGQTAEVKIYRLITRNTYEREMFDRASLKLGLDRAILHREKESAREKKGRVESLLRKGAYGVLMEADDVNEKFCEEEIEAILEGRTRVVRHEDQSGNIFSKASFQVAEEIDDPDFWENLLVKRRAANAENALKRILRKMSRAGLFTEEEEAERVKEIEEKEAAGAEEATINALKVELRGTEAGIDRDKISAVIKAALQGKEKDSGTILGIEWAVKESSQQKKSIEEVNHSNNRSNSTETQLPDKINTERLLFRCQVTELLRGYEGARGVTEIEWKQWTIEDDDLLVEQTRRYGYGLYHIEVDEKTRIGLVKSEKGKLAAVYKGRTRDELNSRIRKILTAINKREDTGEERVSVSAAIQIFGRPTARNRESIVKMFRGRNIITEMTNMIGTIEENMKKRQTRRGGFDAELAKVLTSRISLFDKLGSVEEIPSLRKTPGLPRRWNKENDKEMVKTLCTEGLTKEVCERLEISEETVIKRADAIVRNM